MQAYNTSTVPAISTLALEFAVFDKMYGGPVVSFFLGFNPASLVFIDSDDPKVLLLPLRY